VVIDGNMFVVKCDNGGYPWWINGVDSGDPGRTVLLENAEIFESRKKAKKIMKYAIKNNKHRKLEGRLKIIKIKE